MLLSDIHIINREGIKHIHIHEGRIARIINDGESLTPGKNELHLQLDGALAFPGLINSHDHLDFDLFPQMGNRIYQNYIDWGADIQVKNKVEIQGILNIPQPARVQWGTYKNLLSGITTVVNHGKKLPVEQGLMRVFQDSQSIHSINRERLWKLRLNRMTNRKQPVTVHIGEGTGISVEQEIDRLLRWNFFKRDLIGIHGVAMTEKQASSFKALVWCPLSNYFLFDRTSAIDRLKKQATILFGTDSTLTASWNIWDHLRQARNTGMVTDTELFDMLTSNPAKTWRLDHTGELAANHDADIVIAKPGDSSGKWDAFYQLNPENLLLVMYYGSIRLFDAELLNQLEKNVSLSAFSKVYINGTAKYVLGNLHGLIKEINMYNPGISLPVTCG